MYVFYPNFVSAVRHQCWNVLEKFCEILLGGSVHLLKHAIQSEIARSQLHFWSRQNPVLDTAECIKISTSGSGRCVQPDSLLMGLLY